MMGKSHALSGSVGWLAGCAALNAAGHPPRPLPVVAGAIVSAGFALLPDIDHPGSTVARTLGPLTRTVSRIVSGLSAGFGRATCDHCDRRPGQGGHRLVTHTIPFAVAVTALWALAGHVWGAIASVVVVGLATWLARTPTAPPPESRPAASKMLVRPLVPARPVPLRATGAVSTEVHRHGPEQFPAPRGWWQAAGTRSSAWDGFLRSPSCPGLRTRGQLPARRAGVRRRRQAQGSEQAVRRRTHLHLRPVRRDVAERARWTPCTSACPTRITGSTPSAP